MLLFREPLPLQFCSLPCVDSASGRDRRAWCRERRGLGALIQVCLAGRLNLGSSPEWLLVIWLVPSSLYGERTVEGLHLSDTSRTAVTSNKQLLGKCEDPQFQQKCGSTSCLYEPCMCELISCWLRPLMEAQVSATAYRGGTRSSGHVTHPASRRWQMTESMLEVWVALQPGLVTPAPPLTCCVVVVAEPQGPLCRRGQ